jgi:uncharacterized protein
LKTSTMGLIISLFVGTVFSSQPASSDVRKLERDAVVLEAVQPGVAAYLGKNYEKANRLLKPLAELGNPYAQYYIANIYRDRGDDQKAHSWYQKAAEQGYSFAQFILSRMLITGTGTEQNFVKAVKWLSYSAEQNNKFAQLYLAGMHYEGKGTPTDLVLAYKWLSIASVSELGLDRNSTNDRAETMKAALKLEMTASQIAEAEALSLKWFRGE